MFNSDLYVLGVAIFSVVALSFSTVSAQTILFHDDFNADNTIVANVIKDPSSRGGGTEQTSVKYTLRGNIVVSDGTKKDSEAVEGDSNVPSGSIVDSALRIHEGALDFSAGRTVDGRQITAPDTDSDTDTSGPFARDIGFVDNSDYEFDWSTVLGDRYEISFQLHATNNNPLAFSISNTVTTGRYNPHAYNPGTGPYDFGMNTWTGKWNLGEDGNAETGITGATRGDSFHVRVLIDERYTQATASVFINNSTTALDTIDIDFDSNFSARYFQFHGRHGYGGTLDDLTIATYSVPELSNFSLLTALFLLTGLFALRRSPQV